MTRPARLLAFVRRLSAGWPADDSAVTGTPVRRGDLLLTLLFAALGGAATLIASGLLDPRLLENDTMDVWFEADVPRIFRIVTDRFSANDNAKFHPLFALVVLAPVTALRAITGVDPWFAVRLTYAVAGAVWCGGLLVFLRLIGCRRTDAIAFTLLGATSAGAMFWLPLPETHTLASSTVLFAMLVVAASRHRVIPALVELLASAATLSMTITNWMAGLLATGLRRSVPQAALISAGAFALVVALWSVQKVFVPRSAFFIGGTVGAGHLISPESRGVLHIAESFFMHSVVMPEITVADRPGAGKWPVMLVQPAQPGSAGPWSLVSAVLWCALLATGVWAMFRLEGKERLRLYLGLLLAGQFVLFLLFGNETFLYAPNFLPVLIGVAALSALTPARRVVLAMAVALVFTNAVGNTLQLRRANAFFVTFSPFRHDYAAARVSRPEGPWPSGGSGKLAEVALPGTRTFDTGVALVGGGFAPGLDQFMMSFWVLDDSGAVVARSDALSRDQISPLVPLPDDSSVVEAGVSTPYYRARWRAAGTRHFQLELTIPPTHRVALVVRGVGPPRAPVRQLEWNGDRLLVNRRWTVDPRSPAVAAHLVNEHTPEWATERSTRTRIAVIDGWAAARLELLDPGTHIVDVRDTDPNGPMDRLITTLPGSPSFDEGWEGEAMPADARIRQRLATPTSSRTTAGALLAR